MEFDTNETVGGIKIRGLNYKDDRGDWPWHGEYLLQGYWYDTHWTHDGVSCLTDMDLKPLNTPAPAPAVDWEKPIQFQGKDRELQYVGPVEPPYCEQSRIVFDHSNGFGFGCKEDGTTIDGCHRVINRVAPPRFVTVEVAACEHAEHENELLATRYQDGHIRVVDAKTGSHFVYAAPGYQLEDSLGYRFVSPWVSHEFVLPLTLPLKDDNHG